MIIELKSKIPVVVMSKTLPKGVAESNRKGLCLAWNCLDGANDQWLVVFNETGELVWVPMTEIRLQESWSDNRRYLLVEM